MAETVAALYTKLGLDISDLDSEFAMADRTVRQAMSRLNHETKKIRIETDINLSGLDGAKDRLKKVEIQEASLSRQLDIQREKVKLATAAYQEMVAAKGADSAASAKLETRLLNERKAYANLEAQMKAAGKERAASTVSGRMVGSIINGASATSVITQGLQDMGALAFLKSPGGMALGVGTAVGTGIVAMAKSAMDAGVKIKNLADQMHTTNAEASRMNMIFRLAGADVNAAVAPIIRLDKAVESAGEAGNSTTRILAAFGVNLRNSSGQLLPVTEQLQELARGYQNAQQAGLESEYVAQVLGSRGKELVPVLKDMTELQERASRIPTTGLLNPDEARELSRSWNEMKVSMGQLTGAVGAAFLPVLNEAMPDINAGIEDMVKTIRDNKDDITAFIDVVKEAIGLVGDVVGTVKDVFSALGVDSDMVKDALLFVRDVLKDIRSTLEDIKETVTGTALVQGIGALVRAARQLPVFSQKEEEQPGSKKTERPKEETKPLQDPDVTKRAYRDALEQPSGTGREKQEASRLAQEQQSLEAEAYKNTHSDLQNELHDIDLRAQKYREAGLSEVDITRAAEAAKAKVMQEFNDTTMAQIQRSWQSGLEARLSDIEREKRAWIQKGVDEVTATRWAEREKSKARQSEALSALKENRNYLNIVRQAMQGGGTQEEILSRARTGVLDAMREKYGVKNEYMTPDEISLFSRVMSDARNNLVPGLETDSWARQLTTARRPYEVIRGTESTPAATNVTVNISGGLWTDEGSMKKCADRVADQVNDAIQSVARRADVSY